jgi:hypothetical protein
MFLKENDMKKGLLVLLFCMALMLVVFVSYSEACGGGAARRANRGGLFRGRFQARESVATTYRMSAPRMSFRVQSGACANGQCEVPMSQKK